MNKHFSIVEGLNSFINSSLHKTFFLLISLSLTTSLWSEPQVINFGYEDWGKSSSFSGNTYDDLSQTVGGVEVSMVRNSGSLYANSTASRFYKDNELTFSVASGEITSIVFTCTSFQTDITSDVGTCTATSSEWSWSGNAASVTFTRPSTASGNAQFSAASVTLGTSCTGTKLDAPTNVVATPADGSLTITWSTVTNASKYQVKLGTGDWIDVANTPYTKTGLTNGTTYTYQVKAIGDGSTYCDSDPTAAESVKVGPAYSVTWMSGGALYKTTYVSNGDKPTFPTSPTSCDTGEGASTTFVGWATASWSGKIANLTGKTVYTKASDMPAVTAAVTYYAVFCKGASGTLTITQDDFKSVLTGSYGDATITKKIGTTNYIFNLNACKQNDMCQLRDNATLSYIQIPALPGAITNISTSTCANGSGSSYSGTLHFKTAKTRGNTDDDDITKVTYSGVTSFDWDVSSENTTNTSGYLFTSAGLRLKDLTISYGSGSNYLTSCVTYEVNAVAGSNGSVSVSGYVVTATPATGYVVDTYTITSGSGTITRGTGENINKFTVSPTDNCTVTITFRVAASYTVTLIDNGKTYTETAYEGTPYTLPDEYKSTCPDATFLGWANGEYTNHYTGTSTNPGYTAGGEEVNITEPTTFVAVYGNVELGDNYAALKAEAELTSNANYVVAAYYSSKYYIVKATTSNDRIDSYQTSLTLADSGNEITDAKLVWRINVLNAATKTVTFYNADINKYLSINGDNALCFDDEPFAFTYTVDESGDAATWVFTSTTNTDYKLAFYSTYHQFNAYTTGSNLYLYKQLADNASYTSHPNCCHEPATPLAISAEPTTLIGSGVTTIALEGGNNQNITWSTTGGTLSGQSNTGATLTLSSAGTYTVSATQPDDETDPDNVICGATVTTNITVKAQWTITLKTKDDGSANTYDTKAVTDGDTYTLPDLSEDYTCDEGYSFAGWATSESATAVEKTAGSVITASSTTTWWAVWQSSSGDTETATKWEKVSTTSDLVANATFVLSYNDKAMGSAIADGWAAKIDVDQDADKTYVAYPSSTTGVQVFTLKGSTGAWKFYSAGTNKWLAMTAAGKISWTDTESDAATFDITLSGSNAYIYNNKATSNEYLKYNTGSPRFKGYGESSCAFASLYKNKGNTVTISSSSGVSYFVNNEHCSSGAMIKADGAWITAANGQKVKAIIPVVAKNFTASSTLSVSNISDSHFKATLAETAIPAGSTGLTTTLSVEYLPDASDVLNSTTITLTAGDVNKTITVNGRSLPDEFLMIAKKTLWYAVPANMNDGAGAYNGVNVVPNDGTEPDKVAVAPSTVIYSLKSVANSRYATAGQYVRLAGLGNKGLWANGSTSTATIYNNAPIADSNDGHYEWELATTDGIHYTISNPAHPDAAAGRQLALGGTSGLFYGLYKTATTFFLVPAGCTSQPQEVNVSARRTDATFSWVSNASSFTIDIYTDEAMTALAKSETATSSPYMMLGLNETTEYWFKLTPDGSEDCAVTGKFKTTGPVIDIVEWEENKAIIFVDKDEELHPRIVIDGEVEHGAGSGATATDIFFSKYFEAEGTAKMLGVFNGTTNDIPLADITIVQRSLTGAAKAFSLASYGAQRTGYIKAGEEILFYTRDNREAVMECAEADPTFPNWNNVDGKEGASNFSFGGKGTIRLFRGNTCIDIIGAMVEGNDIDDNKQATVEGADSPSWAPVRDNEKGFVTAYGDNYLTKDVEESDYGLSSCRCLLIRKSFVTSGDSAVLNNFGEFKTLGVYKGVDSIQHKGEWAGLQIPDASGSEKAYIHTCEGFQEVGKFDYSKYYKEWTTVLPGEELDGNVLDAAAKTYEIEIDNLAQYSCLNLKFQLTNKDDVTEIYTEQQVQVPILVKGGHQTVDAIFNSIVKNDGGDPLYDESINRCKTCDVVVLGTGVLTKATDGTPHDAPKIGNLKVYPGGKIVVPTGTTYEINSLALRRQEDALPLADIQGTLNITQPNATYLDIRIDPSNWHYFTLPYDVNVSDITFVDGTPAAIGTDFRIGRYDGEHRAATQSQSWVNLTADDVVKAGIGYIIGLPGSGKVQRELRFPMANSVVAEEQTDKDVEGLHAWGGDKTDEELRPNHKGWNLIGAPYLSYYYTTLQEPLPTGQLIQDPDEDPWKGHWVRNSSSLRYIVVPVDNGMSEYKQVDIANYHMAPFTSYFVQIGGADPATNQKITYNGAQAGKFSVARRAPHEYEEDNHEVWFGINLVNDKNEQDATTLLISDKFTDDYDIMDDLVKMRGAYYQYAQITTKPVLASRNSKGEMAFNALPDASAAAGVPLNFFAAQDGQYRFAVSANYPLDEIKEAYLYDNENAEAKWHNLLEEDYIFTSKRGDNTTRFLLAVKVERKHPEITTALNNTNSRLALTTIDHTLILSGLSNNADIFVYDVSGKLLNRGQYSANMNGVYRTVVDNPGLYFVRVKTDSDLQTLQTLVY